MNPKKRLLTGIIITLCVCIMIGTGIVACLFVAQQSYNSGYQAGYVQGAKNGQIAGKSIGYAQGYSQGKTDGYASGYTQGLSDGNSQGQSDALQTIYDWITGSGCEQSFYSSYIYFDMWRDSTGQLHYTCLV